MIRFKRTASMAILLAVAAMASAGPGVDVELKERSTVRKSSVTVGDVAVLKGGSDELRERMEKIDLGDAPAGGQTLAIKARQVEYRLLLADFPAEEPVP